MVSRERVTAPQSTFSLINAYAWSRCVKLSHLVDGLTARGYFRPYGTGRIDRIVPAKTLGVYRGRVTACWPPRRGDVILSRTRPTGNRSSDGIYALAVINVAAESFCAEAPSWLVH